MFTADLTCSDVALQREPVWWSRGSEARHHNKQGGLRLPVFSRCQVRHWLLEARLWNHPPGTHLTDMQEC